jgi:hypothetical protein
MILVREILLRLEPLPNDSDHTQTLSIGQGALQIEGFSKDQIAYHLRLMAQGDLINHGGVTEDNNNLRNFGGLRWKGHQFINDVRDEDTWNDTKKKIGKVGGVSLEIAWEFAKQYLRATGLG